MFLLAADTSGKNGSIVLAQCEPDGSCELLELVPLTGGTFSAQLIPQIAELLGRHNLTAHDLAGFAVASGPGSFTGLRVGLAAIKGLAEILNKPIAAVSLLEAVARSYSGEGSVLAALDAGRNEVYAGEYELTETAARLVWERVLSRKEFTEKARGRAVITSDGNVAEAARNHALEVHEIAPVRSDTIARLGWKRILAGETVSAQELDANYIRRSDAEIFSKSSSR
jgi:tRNA threonylcarbamoyladenosine biosynthesis protein TsaB